jgi:5-methylcytosine-specific restriction protein B
MPEVFISPDIRTLNADDLAVGYDARARAGHGSSAPDAPILGSNDPRVQEVEHLLRRFGGVILTGPPGTSKSWLAGQLGDVLTSSNDAQRADVQFHATYQYDDFMEGYRPKDDGTGFERRDGVLLRLAKLAEDNPDKPYVLVIDELSRADVGRVFGEALTYVERSKRGLEFDLPSGRKRSIPRNLYLIMTMNPLDRGVDEVDAAFERRFAKVNMPPDPDILATMLASQGLDSSIAKRVIAWFNRINGKAAQNPAASVGHAYFSDVVDLETLNDVWEYQLKYHVERAFTFDPDTRVEIENGWRSIFVAAEAVEEQDEEVAEKPSNSTSQAV